MPLIETLIGLWLLFYLTRGLQRWLAGVEAAMRSQQKRTQQHSHVRWEYRSPAGGSGARPQRPPHQAPAAAAKPPPPPTPWETLGVPQQATPAEIRAAFQKRVREYHPDLVAHLGKELQEVAERRTREILAAHEALKRGGYLG